MTTPPKITDTRLLNRAVRFALWVGDIYRHSSIHRESPEIPPNRLKRMAEALCFAA